MTNITNRINQLLEETKDERLIYDIFTSSLDYEVSIKKFQNSIDLQKEINKGNLETKYAELGYLIENENKEI